MHSNASALYLRKTKSVPKAYSEIVYVYVGYDEIHVSLKVAATSCYSVPEQKELHECCVAIGNWLKAILQLRCIIQ